MGETDVSGKQIREDRPLPGRTPGEQHSTQSENTMLKNRIYTAFAFAGLLSFAACAGEDDAAVIEEPVVEEPAPIVEPVPAVTDTAAMPMTDTAAMPMADTAAH